MDRMYRAKLSVKVFGKKTEGRPLLKTITRKPYEYHGFDNVTFNGELYPVYWNGIDGNFISVDIPYPYIKA